MFSAHHGWHGKIAIEVKNLGPGLLSTKEKRLLMKYFEQKQTKTNKNKQKQNQRKKIVNEIF